MIIEEETYLKHFGVQGMRWGVRRSINKASVNKLRSKGLTGKQAKRTVFYQNVVDAQRMAATGRRGRVSVLEQLNNRSVSNMHLSLGTIARHPLSTKKAAGLQLEKNRLLQAKIGKGQAKVRNWLFEMRGISIKNIDYSLKGASKPTDYSRKKGNKIPTLVSPTSTRRPALAIP
jgi:hypothetical protein